jgi:hypothetical protein
MEAEELEYLEYERSLTEEKDQSGAAQATEQANMNALEARLEAMRLAKRNSEQSKVQSPAKKEDVRTLNQSVSIRPRVNRSLESRQKVVAWAFTRMMQWLCGA